MLPPKLWMRMGDRCRVLLSQSWRPALKRQRVPRRRQLMFDSIRDHSDKLTAAGYFIDLVITQACGEGAVTSPAPLTNKRHLRGRAGLPCQFAFKEFANGASNFLRVSFQSKVPGVVELYLGAWVVALKSLGARR